MTGPNAKMRERMRRVQPLLAADLTADAICAALRITFRQLGSACRHLGVPMPKCTPLARQYSPLAQWAAVKAMVAQRGVPATAEMFGVSRQAIYQRIANEKKRAAEVAMASPVAADRQEKQ